MLLAQFLTLLKAVEEHTRLHEPKVSSYWMSEDPHNPLQLYLFEQYDDDDAWQVTHMSSPPAKILFAHEKKDELVEEMVVKVSTPSGVGFRQRAQ